MKLQNKKTKVYINSWKQSAELMEGIAAEYSQHPAIKTMAKACFSLQDVFLIVGSLFEFVGDVNEQTYRTPARLIKEQKGNCVDASILVSSILTALELPHSFEFGANIENKPFHVWVKCGGVIIDTVRGRTEYKTKFFPQYYNTELNLPYIYNHEIKF